MVVPLFQQNIENPALLGLLGAVKNASQHPDDEQREALVALSQSGGHRVGRPLSARESF